MAASDGRGTPPLSVGTASTVTGPTGPVAKVIQRKFHRTYKDDDWEIMRGLKLGETVPKEKPQKHEGYVMKRRKWPLKGEISELIVEHSVEVVVVVNSSFSIASYYERLQDGTVGSSSSRTECSRTLRTRVTWLVGGITVRLTLP